MKIKRNWIKIALLIAAIMLIIVGIYLFLPSILNVIGYLIELFLPFILGYVFSLLINPLADRLQNKMKIPRGLSAILVMVLIIGILGGVLTFAVWKIIDESRMLYTQFPSIYISMRDGMHAFGEKWSTVYVNLPLNIQESITAFGDEITDKAAMLINNVSSPLVNSAGSFAKALPRVFVAVIVFLLSSYFMVSESRSVSEAVKRISSPQLAHRFSLIKREVKKYLGGYVKAQGMLMIITFVVMFIGLTIFNIQYALLIALGVAIVDALPFFGSGIVLWPWTVIAFLNGNIKFGIGLLCIYIAVTVIRRFAEPKLVSSGMGMNPILTLMSMYIGYKTLSIGGLILGPIIMMLIISFYKAGVFDAPIRLLKSFCRFIKEQFVLLKQFIINLMRSDWNE